MASIRCSHRALSLLTKWPANLRASPRLHVHSFAQHQLRAFNSRLPLRSQQPQASLENNSSSHITTEATSHGDNAYTVEQLQELEEQQIAEAYNAAEDILTSAQSSEQTRLSKSQRRKIERYSKYPATVSFQDAPASTETITNTTTPAEDKLNNQSTPTIKKKKKEKWPKEKKKAAAEKRQREAEANAPAPAPAREKNKAGEQTTKPKKKERWSDEKKKAAAAKKTAEENKKKEHWQLDKEALREKLGGEQWRPRKRLSPDALEGIRALHAKDPYKFNTPILAEEFKVSPDAIRRILKSKWKPSEEEELDRARRWEERGEKIWSQLAASGVRPPKKWRQMGVGRVERGERPAWMKGGKKTIKDAKPFKGGNTESEVIARNLAAASMEEEDWSSRIV